MQMAKSFGKSLFRLMIFIIVLECPLTARIPATSLDASETSISTKFYSPLLWSTLSGQAEEEILGEKSHKTVAIKLVDLSRNISFLAKIHAPRHIFIAETYIEAHRPSLQELFCIFIMWATFHISIDGKVPLQPHLCILRDSRWKLSCRSKVQVKLSGSILWNICSNENLPAGEKISSSCPKFLHH